MRKFDAFTFVPGGIFSLWALRAAKKEDAKGALGGLRGSLGGALAGALGVGLGGDWEALGGGLGGTWARPGGGPGRRLWERA